MFITFYSQKRRSAVVSDRRFDVLFVVLLDMFVARRVADILDKALDVLLLTARTYHQHIVGINDDIVL